MTHERFIADLHVHSRYARACSKELTPENIERWCRIKGIQVVSTGDFTHPKWVAELAESLIPSPESTGLYSQKNVPDSPVRFICGTELSSIYTHAGKVRRVHNLVFAPSLEIVKKINSALTERGCNIRSDGRPIIGLSSHDLLEMLLEIDERNVLIPAHAWTPWFAVFGSKSGYNSLAECFGDLTEHVFAIETGLSSDPLMNWQVSQLDDVALISSSDAHSLPNLGREATIFSGQKISYDLIMTALRHGNPKYRQTGKLTADSFQLSGTIEFYPHEGRYHYDGHRDCGIVLHPAEADKQKKICPKCQRRLTVGVLSRVNELADRPEGTKPNGAPTFHHLVELDKIIADALGLKARASTKVQKIYQDLMKKFDNEIAILLDVPIGDLQSAEPRLAEAIERVRQERLTIQPGFDGEYGKIEIFSEKERQNGPRQLTIL